MFATLLRKFILTLICIYLHIPLILGFQQEDTIRSQEKNAFSDDQIKKFLQMDIEELMNQKVTSGYRYEDSVKNLPVTIKVINRNKILRNNYHSLVDVLKDIPGIKVSQPGSAIHGEMFLLRGLIGNRHAKLLIDGIPFEPSITDGIPLDEQIFIKNAERIEIISSGASSLYGANAMGGVINIVPVEKEYDLSRIETNAGINYLSSNYFSHNYLGKNTHLNIYGSFKVETDMNIVEPNKQLFSGKDLNGNNIEVNNLKSKTFSTGVRFRKKNFTFSYDHIYRKANSSLGQDPALYIYDDPSLFWGETINRAAIKHLFKNNKLSLRSHLGYLSYRLDINSAFGMTIDDDKLYKYQASDDISIEELINYNASEHLSFSGGASFRLSSALPKTNDLTKSFDPKYYKPFDIKIPPKGIFQDTVLGNFGFNPLTYSNTGVFIHGVYSTKKLKISIGGRMDYHSVYGKDFYHRFAFLYHINPKTTFRLTYNEGAKVPAGYQTYNSIANVKYDSTGNKGINYIGLPNKDLKREKSNSIELGIRHLIKNDFYIQLLAYRNEINGLITNTGVKFLDSANYPLAINNYAKIFTNDPNAESILYGFQFDMNYQQIIPSINLGSDYSITYFKGSEVLPGGSKINHFRKVPDVLSKLKIYAKPIKNLWISLDNTICGPWYGRQINSTTKDKNDINYKTSYHNPKNKSDSYYLLDVTLKYKNFTEFGVLNFYLKGINLLNEGYGGIGAYGTKDMAYNPQYGRRLIVGMSFSY